MAKLVINAGQPEAVEIELREGTNRLGRRDSNDVQIDHASVSGAHCEIFVQGGAVHVRDLNSTNGTFIDGARIIESALQPGQTLQLGEVRMLYAALHMAQAAAAPGTEAEGFSLPVEAPAPAAAPIVCANHPGTPAQVVCHHCGQLFCDACVNLRRVGAHTLKFCLACNSQCEPLGAKRIAPAAAPERSFFAMLPGAFKYPFKRDGVMLLVGGALFLTFMSWLIARAFLFTIMLSILTFGYLAAYLQAIVATSAQGEPTMPRWPDLSNFWDDVVLPYFQMIGTLAACFGPAVLVLLGGGGPVLASLVALLGTVYFPMAWLAVSMVENLAGLNPMMLIPSMLKVPGDYAIAVIVCWVVFVVQVAAVVFVPMLLSAVTIPLPGVLSVFVQFVWLYFLAVNMRILGLLYYTNRKRLGWF
ncbi:MAG: FHA domain-containing protein [Verrucomicrobia bacterium]|nr:FHA domain-containing protein [Verrucomicrobiota bacterium]